MKASAIKAVTSAAADVLEQAMDRHLRYTLAKRT